MDWLPPAEPLAFSASGLLISGQVLYVAVRVRESSGTAAARVDLLDGSSTGVLLDTVTLNPNESVRDIAPHQGVRVNSGLFVNVASGAVVGTCWVIPESSFPDLTFPSEWLAGYRSE